MPVSLVIFDLDGTLVDSAADLAHAVNGMLRELGREPLEVGEVRGMIGDGIAKLVERALAARALSSVDAREAQRMFLEHYEAEPVRATAPYPGVRAVLERLRAETIRLAVCTNKPAHLAEAVLAGVGLAEFFTEVIGGDSLPFRKPDPRVLHSLLASFATAPHDALMVGDSEVDAAAATAAGVPLVLMTYGYRRGPVEHIPCLAALDRFEALPALIAPAAAQASGPKNSSV